MSGYRKRITNPEPRTLSTKEKRTLRALFFVFYHFFERVRCISGNRSSACTNSTVILSGATVIPSGATVILSGAIVILSGVIVIPSGVIVILSEAKNLHLH